jgi:hypothetical protein
MRSESDKKTKVPSYCSCSEAEYIAAQEEYKRLRLDFAWIAMANFRRSALAATFGNAGFIEPLLAVEFQDVIEDKKYTPIPTTAGSNAQWVEKERAGRAKWQEEQAEAAKKPRPLTLREASMFKSPLDYQTWLRTPEGLAALKQGWF